MNAHSLLLYSVTAAWPWPIMADVLHDNLCITDQGRYINKYSSSCGGSGIWGESHDRQAADDFPLTQPHWITSVTADLLFLLGTGPDHACVAFYAADGENCSISEVEHCWLTVDRQFIVIQTFEDDQFGHQGRRLTLSFRSPCLLRGGHWYLSVQPASEEDWGYVPGAQGYEQCPYVGCDIEYRDGREDNPCCASTGVNGETDWQNSGSFENQSTPLRIEGIRAGDCVGGERVRARCRGDDQNGLDLVVKIREGAAGRSVTALLDPPDPQSISIPLDETGRGKGKFKRIQAGEHRVFVCDAVVDVFCTR